MLSSVYPVHVSPSEVNLSSADAQVISCHRYLVVFHPFVEQLSSTHLDLFCRRLLSSESLTSISIAVSKGHMPKRYVNYRIAGKFGGH